MNLIARTYTYLTTYLFIINIINYVTTLYSTSKIQQKQGKYTDYVHSKANGMQWKVSLRTVRL
jgi:hypothetical protein